MKPIPALLAALLPALAAAQPPVDVRFADLARFSDLRNTELRDERESNALAEELRRYLEAKAPGRLPPGTRADGRVEREGRRELRDLGFLSRTRLHEREALAHEKALLDDWLKREFPAAR